MYFKWYYSDRLDNYGENSYAWSALEDEAILKRNRVEWFQRLEHVAVNKVQYRPKTINVSTVCPMRENKMWRMLASIAPYPKSSQFNLSDFFRSRWSASKM